MSEELDGLHLWKKRKSFIYLVLFTPCFHQGILGKIIKIKICAICGAVSITWIALLILYYFGYFSDKLLLGILMGQSITGAIYLYERKVEKTKYKWLLLFRILIIIAGTAIVYLILK